MAVFAVALHEVQHLQIVTLKPIIMPGMSSRRSADVAALATLL